MKKITLGYGLLFTLIGLSFTSATSLSAASIFTEDFGTGSTSSMIGNGWVEGGDGAEKRAPTNSGNDTASPDTGRFALIKGEDGYICRVINTIGNTNVQLSYHWRGDADVAFLQNNSKGKVSIKPGNSTSACNSNSNAWTELKEHDMRNDNSWTTQSAFTNNGMNNTRFLLKFEADTKHEDEHFRVDGISITGTPPNAAPIANNQIALTDEDMAKAITLTGTDTDIPAQTLTYTVLASPTHGALSGTAPNLTYTPTTNYSGPDSFTFTVNDGTLTSNTATVSITVSPRNDAPTLSNVAEITVDELTAATFTAVATDIENDTLTYALTGAPSGAVIGASTGIFSWTPSEAQGPLTHTFNVTVTDGNGGGSSQPVKIQVKEVNLTPAGSELMVTTQLNASKTITLVGTDADVPTQTLTYAIGVAPTHGALGSVDGNHVTYTPEENYVGSDSFTYTVNDGMSTSLPTTVSITVSNDAPTLSELSSRTVSEESVISFTALGTDPNSDPLTYSMTSAPTGATLDPQTGAFSWTTTEADGPGVYTITIKVTDGQATDSKIITLTVTEVNVSPIASNNTKGEEGEGLVTDEDTSVTSTLNATDTDVPVQSLTYATTSSPLHGVITMFNEGTGAFTYTPNLNYNGTDSFTFTANDGTVTSNVATILITVRPVNDAPVITINAPQPFVFGEAYPYTQPLATATDVEDGDITSRIIVTGTVESKILGTYELVYSVTDSNELSTSSTLTLIVVPTLGGGGNTSPVMTVGSITSSSPTPSIGEVLGASTTTLPVLPKTTETPATCGEYMPKTILRRGKNNDEKVVKLLQQFLNDILKTNIPLTGYFGKETEDAVRKFQELHKDTILTPWKLNASTGIVYKTTISTINSMMCPRLKAEVDPLELIPHSER